jgi:hypothetical protein
MTAAATAASFVWLGMALGTSLLETPLKFRAPGVDLQTGLGIGRLVSGAFNGAEIVLAAALLTCLFTTASASAANAAIAGTTILLIQVFVVRPERRHSNGCGRFQPGDHQHLERGF